MRATSTVPFPLTSALTSYSTNRPADTDPMSATSAPNDGFVAHVSVPSAHGDVTGRTSGPLPDGSVTHNRSLAPVGARASPATSNRRKLSVVGDWSATRRFADPKLADGWPEYAVASATAPNTPSPGGGGSSPSFVVTTSWGRRAGSVSSREATSVPSVESAMRATST